MRDASGGAAPVAATPAARAAASTTTAEIPARVPERRRSDADSTGIPACRPRRRIARWRRRQWQRAIHSRAVASQASATGTRRPAASGASGPWLRSGPRAAATTRITREGITASSGRRERRATETPITDPSSTSANAGTRSAW